MATIRPWGYYEVLGSGSLKGASSPLGRGGSGGTQSPPLFKSKLITVYPHKRLSLQSHQYRSEHWVCISGHGYAQINEEMLELIPDRYVFIHVGDKHRLINDSDQPLVITEVQTGEYFGEDDIVRYEDDYGRGGEAPLGASPPSPSLLSFHNPTLG